MTEQDGESSAEMKELAAEIDQVGDRAARTVELGRRGFTISLFVFVLLIGQILPWVGGVVGWEVLVGHGGGVPQLFAATSTAIGVFASALTLATRRWWLSWVCAAGGWFASVDGLLAIWSQQSSHASGATGGGPGIGMIVAWIATICLAVQWMRTAFSRS
ncbi:hypothetical protein ACFWY9_30510 [Amycolatopsis sp. NPDC059027]|uniref:Rv2732c family membrane protein n=1 Tax=Amycolatopsis sp. NPDC059027 TaxID=3346709 RepID=UPI003671B88E